MTIAGRALRLVAGGAIAWGVSASLAAPEFSLLCRALAVAIAGVTLWRQRYGLVLTVAMAPAGALLAAAPARAAELFAWSLLAGWLLALWRPLSHAGWPRRVMLPLGLYAGALIASWLSLTVSGAAGIPPAALPQFILRAVRPDYLAISTPEPETWTLLAALAGLGVFIAATAIVRSDPRMTRWLGGTLVGSLAVLAVATCVAVGRQWADAGYDIGVVLRYVQSERFSLPLADVNAAGSLYALAAVVAIGRAWRQYSHRWIWLLALAALAPAIWLAGSRSAYLAIAAGAVAFVGLRHRWQPTRRHVIVTASLVFAAMVVGAVVLDPQSDVEGSAGQSANLRSQFLLTSARMFASAPIFGVGVGRYWGRSADFMTPELRERYGNENAHNYFAQQFTELGLVGGTLFAWLVAVVLWQGWRAVVQTPDDIPLQALFAGTIAYLVTCATGHPLLVPEAALPFWAAFGAVAAGSPTHVAVSKTWRVLAIAAGGILVASVGRAALAYTRPVDVLREQGFHQVETTSDGAEFRWMTRHAVTYIPDGPGFLRLRVRAPGWPARGPVVLETSIDGQVVDRRQVLPDDVGSWDVPVRDTARTGLRRVDLRVNQEWFEDVRLGQRPARRPVSLIVERIAWMPLR